MKKGWDTPTLGTSQSRTVTDLVAVVAVHTSSLRSAPLTLLSLSTFTSLGLEGAFSFSLLVKVERVDGNDITHDATYDPSSFRFMTSLSLIIENIKKGQWDYQEHRAH